ncbi:hypothetical protein FRC07_005121 [Ceratobasidium sp. 392]|nr:hypothetical protein FRC07_005121 [Ceratobasidium sp. 392]
MVEDQLETSDVLTPPAGSSYYYAAKPHRFLGNIVAYYSGWEENKSKYHQEMKELKLNNWDHLFWALRGCLIVLCPQLNEPEHVRAEVVTTVAAPKQSPTGKSVAVVYSGKHVIAVAVDGTVVRHTPPLLVHDLKLNIQIGALLLVHLLDAQIGNKTFQALSRRFKSTFRGLSGTFPEEILIEIIHYSDHDTWLQLSRVSYFTRSICLMYPRINDSVLLRTVEGGYLIRHQTTGYQQLAHLRRTEWNVHKHLNSTFHIRQVGFIADQQNDATFTVLQPSEDLYKCFTESHKTDNMIYIANLRLLGIWGRWTMKVGVTKNEHRAATPKRPAYWMPGLSGGEEVEDD